MKLRWFVLLTLLLLASPALSQPGPIYFVEHDWTVRVGRARFGVLQDKILGDEKYGGGRKTTLYIGRPIFRARTQRFQVGAWGVILGVSTFCLTYLFVRSGRNRSTEVTDSTS